MEITRSLSRFVVDSEYSEIPQRVRHEAVRAFVNWLGCALGGCKDEAVDAALASFEAFSGPGASTVIGRGKRVDMLTATLLNTLSHSILSYNDIHPDTTGHPSGPVAATLFAMAEQDMMRGREFLHALVLGVDVECRIANAIAKPPAHCHLAISTVGLTTAFGAAAAAGKVLGLSEQQMIWALGHAAAQGSGIRSTHASMASHFLPAHSARSGLVAAVLARNGFTCSDDSIESPKGFVAAFANPGNMPAATEALGERYELMAVGYKPYPCGVVSHAAIDACLELAGLEAFDAGDVARIELLVNPITIQLGNRPQPKNRLQATVSVQHWAAAALLHGCAGLAQGSDECVNDPAVAALRARISLAGDESTQPEAASATIWMRDGRSHTARVEHCRGSRERPMTDDELGRKFLELAANVLPRHRAEELLDQSWHIGDLNNVGALGKQFLQPG